LALLVFALEKSYGEPATKPFEEPSPVAIKQVAPLYPDSARKAGVKGAVLVQALVGNDGRVKETKVLRSIRGLDVAAVSAARQWVFKPAMANGKPVSMRVALPFRFGPGDWREEDEADGKRGPTQTWAVVVRADTSLSLLERVAYYVARLRDSTYIEYSEDGEPRAWLVAPEELGLIGAPALPLLMQELECAKDVYERTQIFYALLLAAQGPGTEDAAARAELTTISTRFPMALPPLSEHASLKRLWLEWWVHRRGAFSCTGSP
jgi:TonB family protein